MSKFIVVGLAALSLFASIFNTMVVAQPGSNDLAFNVGIGANAIVDNLYVFEDGSVIYSGGFSFVNNIAASRLVKLNALGAVDETFQFAPPYGASTRIVEILPQGDSLLIRGIGSANTSTVYFITRIAADGTLDDSFPMLEFNKQINKAHVFDDGSILVSGNFDQINGENSPPTVLFDKNGRLVSGAVVPNLGFRFWDVLQKGDFLVYLLTIVNDQIQSSIKKTSPIGDNVPDFSSDLLFTGTKDELGNFRGRINVVEELPNGTILIGGDFDTVNGVTMPCLVAIDANGEILDGFDSGFKARECRTFDILFLHENQIMIAGEFTTYKDLDYSGVIQIRSDGSLVASFKTADDLTKVRRIEAFGDDRAYISGPFERIDGKSQQYMARLVINSISTSVEADPESIPSAFSLKPNFPNPFNPSTTLRVELPEASNVDVTVYDLTGRLVMQLPARSLQAGRHNISLDASGLGSGVYVYRVSAGIWSSSGKMTLVK